MQITRFYALEGSDLTILAKYRTEAAKTLDQMKELARPLVEGIHGATDPVEFLNAKFLNLDERLTEAGFERMDVVDTRGLDKECSHTFDVVIDPDTRTVKVLMFKMSVCDAEPGYLKEFEDSYTLGLMIQ